MKKYTVTCIVFFTALLFSCKKPTTTNQNPPLSEVVEALLNQANESEEEDDDSTIRSYVWLDVQENLGQIEDSNKISISALASFENEEGQRVSVGKLTINSLEIPRDINNNYNKEFLGQDRETANEWIGRLALIDYDEFPDGGGGGGGSVTVPQLIGLSGYNVQGSTLSSQDDLTLRWTPDPNNKYKKVGVEVRYLSTLSKQLDASFPQAVPNLIYIVDDNGSLTISRNELARFPVGSYVRITVIRADDVKYTTRWPKYRYVATTQVMSTPLLFK